MVFDDWSEWKRATALNLTGSLGLLIGFFSAGVRLSPDYYAYASVFALAYLNFMFLVVRPQLLEARRTKPESSMWHVLLKILRDRLFIIVLVVLQLLGVSRSAGTSARFLLYARSAYVRGLANATVSAHRLTLISVEMTFIALIWLLSAIGLWQGRSWAWWLAVVLNGLAAGISAAVQLASWHSYALDTFPTIALVFLFLPMVRNRGKKVVVNAV